MTEVHLSEVETTLRYISEARDRAARARTALETAGAEPHLVSALRDAERSLADDHRKLMQRAFFAVPGSDQERSPSSSRMTPRLPPCGWRWRRARSTV